MLQVERALAQTALTRLVEEPIAAEDISTDERRERYRAEYAKYDRPERRSSRHVLARVKAQNDMAAWEEARQFIVQVIDALADSEEPASDLGQYAGIDRGAFAVRIETLPAVARDGSFQKAFEDALFTMAAPGLYGEPVRTSFGWHAVVLTHIEPESHQSFEEVEEEIVGALLQERRARQLEEVLERAREKHPVERDEALVEQLAREGIPQLDGASAP
jgi:hypothetical protein